MTKTNDVLLLLGRIAIAAVFIPAGFSKLTILAGVAAGLEGRGVPMSSILGPLARPSSSSAASGYCWESTCGSPPC
jgi:uncharacterized membrane protein YphA (DoxX/SURF4 family)